MLENEIDDDDLVGVAGGGTYTKDGFLKTTSGYSCGHFECDVCGRTDVHGHDYDGELIRSYTVKGQCRHCKWHTALRCGNPVNKK